MGEIARLKGFYFSYFAYVGILSPYLSLYFSSQGYSVAQIGVLMTVPALLRIVSPPFWGWLADRSGRSDHLLRISSLLTLLSVASLPLASGNGYYTVMALLAAMYFVSGAQVPIGESRTLRVTDGDAGQYGRIRLWGSVGFIAGVALTGPLLDRLGSHSMPLWAAMALGALCLVVWAAPELPPSARSDTEPVRLRSRIREPYLVAFLIANFLMIFSHAALYILFSLYLESFGYSKAVIGLCWAIGVVAEVVLFRVQRPIFERFGALNLLMFSLAVAALRFAMVGLSDGALVIIVVTQIMHMVTFGLHHSAVMKLLHQWFPPSQQARAQAMYLTVAYGCGGTLGGLMLSYVWERGSPPAAYFCAALAAFVGFVATLCCRRWAPGRVA